MIGNDRIKQVVWFSYSYKQPNQPININNNHIGCYIQNFVMMPNDFEVCMAKRDKYID